MVIEFFSTLPVGYEIITKSEKEYDTKKKEVA